MEMSPVFFKIRNVAFACIIAVSLVWAILLCVEISTRYDVSDPSQRNLVGVLIFINAVTSIMLPILLIAEFRAWLDAARLVFLLLVHVGTAALFTAWNPGFTCPNQTGDAVGVCQLINMYILLGSWVIPAMLVWYSAVLGVMFYLRSRYPVPPKMPEKRESELPMMLPSRHASTMMSPPAAC
ncbi:hypothetical protein A0H81_04149 [Grifola frondosa]|uniref:MARVEL domain-containing protein n=1 Tax=Grifola frondosa TaxID=5627 RepID=A0A1C7MJU4_GRIFR|nr:hypothetical protein A0H81_04149 [Grifola frondosa]